MREDSGGGGEDEDEDGGGGEGGRTVVPLGALRGAETDAGRDLPLAEAAPGSPINGVCVDFSSRAA